MHQSPITQNKQYEQILRLVLQDKEQREKESVVVFDYTDQVQLSGHRNLQPLCCKLLSNPTVFCLQNYVTDK